jgi:hypothetical protein
MPFRTPPLVVLLHPHVAEHIACRDLTPETARRKRLLRRTSPGWWGAEGHPTLRGFTPPRMKVGFVAFPRRFRLVAFVT